MGEGEHIFNWRVIGGERRWFDEGRKAWHVVQGLDAEGVCRNEELLGAPIMWTEECANRKWHSRTVQEKYLGSRHDQAR